MSLDDVDDGLIWLDGDFASTDGRPRVKDRHGQTSSKAIAAPTMVFIMVDFPTPQVCRHCRMVSLETNVAVGEPYLLYSGPSYIFTIKPDHDDPLLNSTGTGTNKRELRKRSSNGATDGTRRPPPAASALVDVVRIGEQHGLLVQILHDDDRLREASRRHPAHRRRDLPPVPANPGGRAQHPVHDGGDDTEIP